MAKAKVSISYANCSVAVLGIDMHCPLCKTLVKSGERHQCSKPEIEAPKKRRKLSEGKEK